MITQLSAQQREVVEQNNGLSSYLGNLEIGRPMTPRSWLYEDQDPDQVLKLWVNMLAQLENRSTFEQRVYHFELPQLEKWGPQGGVEPMKDLVSLAERGFKTAPLVTEFESDAWLIAKREAYRQLFGEQEGMLRPLQAQKVVDDMRLRDTLETNSGWPLFTTRKRPDVVTASVRDAENGSWKTYPAIALFRNYNRKTRLVWMFPMSANIAEGQFQQCLQMFLRQRLTPFLAPWEGFEFVKKSVSEGYADSAKAWCASDFSTTDETFTINHTRQVYDVIGRAFQPQYRRDLWVTLENMHKIPLVIGHDKIIVGEHGVSSGSTWTNFVETIFDKIFALYNGIREGYAIGDDIAYLTKKSSVNMFPKMLATSAGNLGLVVNPEKVSAEPDHLKSLQRLFQRGYKDQVGLVRGVYPTIRALKSSIFPEKFHNPELWSSNMFCARQFMILENCVDHPLFVEFVHFVCKGQKDLIPFAKLNDADLRKIQATSRLVPGLNPTYNQEKRDKPLHSFDSIKVARKM